LSQDRYVAETVTSVVKVQLTPWKVYWSESGELVCLACEDTFYILRFSRENFVAAVQAGEVEDDGVEAAFEVITDINERYVILDHYALCGS
jgi:coatomer subunit beta'